MAKRKKRVKKNSYDDVIWMHPKFLVISLVVIVGVLFGYSKLIASAATCQNVATVSKGTLSAAKVASKNETITGDVDAKGCDIGVYVGSDIKNVTVSAVVHDANQYGVFNDGDVTVSGAEISKIGNHDGSGTFAPNGSQTGVGVYFATNSNASGAVKSSYVHDYQKGGIVISTKGSSVNVTGNRVVGLSNVPFIAQNGIQFGYGATGNVKENTVDGNWYDGANWSSTGILVFETYNVNVDKNQVNNNQVGIGVEAWCWIEPSASNNSIVNNNVTGSEWGVSVGAVGFPGYSTCNAAVNNNKVTNNVVTNATNTGEEGVSVWTFDSDPTYTPTAENNKVIANSIEGFTTAVSQFGDSKSKVHANKVIEP